MSTVSTSVHPARVGANRLPNGTWEFLVWAPNSNSVFLHLLDPDKVIQMQPGEHGYHQASVDGVDAGRRYLYRLQDGRELPDPASRFQPEGVHKASAVVDIESFRWTDHNWKGIHLEDAIFYELHVGTYTSEGTFDALIRRLPDLVELGVTMIEIMPVAQFSGSRNWGYDGVYPFATQNSYGGPDAFHGFVDAAHAHGLGVTLDVVYNHLGPEGNYLSAFGPYFTERYRTPWGQAINYDGEDSDEVRRYFIENALYWFEDVHVDALRLDAVHGIFDFGARHFLAELKERVDELSRRLGRPLYLIAESDLNDNRLLRDKEHGGYALDTQWADDFHHSVHTLLTGEQRGYYADFGRISELTATLRDGWCYRGQYSVHRRRRHGNSPEGIASRKFVVCNQNHDQVGNRAAGDRLSTLVSFEALKLAAGVTLLSPFLPLLFMGEEYGEPAPFQYFTSHGDHELVEAVRRGRREEFAAFGWEDSVPDPQAEQTFARSHLNSMLKQSEPHKTLYGLYRELIRIRKALRLGSRESRTIRELGQQSLLLHYPGAPETVVLFNFADRAATVKVPDLAGNWTVLLDSAAESWRGPSSETNVAVNISPESRLGIFPYSFLLWQRVE
jgi:maltooligosyltrehalose trehalohydrolase